MALRRFRGASTTSTVLFTGQAFNRELLDTGSANGSNGSSVVLAAGASASFYLISATGVPNLTTSLTGSWEAAINFQSVVPTNVFCKFRVHRISVSGTTPTILASTEYSAEVQARATNTAYIANTDGTDLGTFASGNRIAVEWTLRNAGAASISPQPSFGLYASFVRTPIESSAAVGWTGTLGRAAYRPISYSEGTINGVKRTGRVRNTITSSGTATGTQGGANFSGSVTGVSTSTGTIAAGRQGYKGSITGTSASSGTIAAGRQGYNGATSGSSTSSGTIAAGVQGYTGSISGLTTSSGVIAAGVYGYSGTVIGASTSSGTIAAGLQGYDGSTTGSSTSAGTVHGTPSPQPTPDGIAVPWWYLQQEHQPQPAPLQVLALTGKVTQQATYVTARLRGRPGMAGSAKSAIRVESFITIGAIGYSGQTAFDATSTGKATGKRYIFEDVSDLLVMMGEL